jgi:hypothetical protein
MKSIKKKAPVAAQALVDALRSQLEDERSAMEQLLKEQELENEQKEAAIRKLGEKFRRVQRGLSRMEKDRKQINSNKEKAEKENIHLRKLLHIRDKELRTFNLHDAMGSEATAPADYDPAVDLEKALKGMTVPDSIDVPQFGTVDVNVSDNQMTQMMTNLELQLSLRDEHVDKLMDEVRRLRDDTRDRMSLERMLRESEGSQSLMKVQLDRMEDDYKQVVGSLSSCFENMKKMTASYKMKEAERTEVAWEANRYIAEQRASHLKNCKQMAKELYKQQVRIQELEALTGSNDSAENEDPAGDDKQKPLSLEEIVLDNSRVTAFAFKAMQHKKEIENLRVENEQRISEAVQTSQQQIDSLSQTLLGKEMEIQTLREDMSAHMQEVMKLSTEVNELKDSPSIKEDSPSFEELEELEEKRKGVSPTTEVEIQSTFTAGYDSDLDIEGISVISDLDDGTASWRKMRPSSRKSGFARASLSGTVNDQGSVTISARSLHAFEEESGPHSQASRAMEEKIKGMALEKISMLVKLSEAGTSIQTLERNVQTEQATVGLLRTNIGMMEHTMVEKDSQIKELYKEIKQMEALLSSSNTSDELIVDDDVVTLKAELALLQGKIQSETSIMQAMIRVLNGQVFDAMKALEIEQQKVRDYNAPEAPVEVDERVALLQRDLDNLQRKSQLALQLSQAELYAVKSKLGTAPATDGTYTLGLDWLSARKRSPSTSPIGSPMSPSSPRKDDVSV